MENNYTQILNNLITETQDKLEGIDSLLERNLMTEQTHSEMKSGYYGEIKAYRKALSHYTVINNRGMLN